MKKSEPFGKLETIELDPKAYTISIRLNPEFAATLKAIQTAFDLQAENVRAELEQAARQMGIESIPEHDRDAEQQAWLAARYLELDRRRSEANQYETLRRNQLRARAQWIIDARDVDAVTDLLDAAEE